MSGAAGWLLDACKFGVLGLVLPPEEPPAEPPLEDPPLELPPEEPPELPPEEPPELPPVAGGGSAGFAATVTVLLLLPLPPLFEQVTVKVLVLVRLVTVFEPLPVVGPPKLLEQVVGGLVELQLIVEEPP